MKPTDPQFTVYCRMTCLGGSERGLCGCLRPDACELAGDPGYAAARGAAQDRMLRAVPFFRRHFGLDADRGREAPVIPLRWGEQGGAMKRAIESLHGMIEVKRAEEPPRVVFALIRGAPTTGADGAPEQHLNMELFVRLKVLPPDLQALVRAAIPGRGTTEEVAAGMHPDTRAEHEAGLARIKEEP